MKYLIPFIVILIGLTVVVFVGRKAPQVPIVAVDCCQVGADKCASGVGVTQAYCEEELDGTFTAGLTCNTDTGQCE
jgi:hypothetical protein